MHTIRTTHSFPARSCVQKPLKYMELNANSNLLPRSPRVHQSATMFSPLPQSVRDQSQRVWEVKRMQNQDVDVSCALSSDSEMDCISEADSTTSRKIKLNKLVCNMNSNQREHLCAIKRKAQKRLHNVQCRNKGGNELHLQGLVNDIAGVLNLHAGQTRGSDGKYGSTTKH